MMALPCDHQWIGAQALGNSSSACPTRPNGESFPCSLNARIDDTHCCCPPLSVLKLRRQCYVASTPLSVSTGKRTSDLGNDIRHVSPRGGGALHITPPTCPLLSTPAGPPGWWRRRATWFFPFPKKNFHRPPLHGAAHVHPVHFFQ